MSELFENIALQDDTEIINHRKASAVANKRVKDRFGAFLANAASDLPARVALVEDDIHAIVEDVVAEYGGDAQKIEAAIKRSMDPFSIGMQGPPGASPGAGTGPNPSTGLCPNGQPPVNGQCVDAGTAGAGAGMGFGMTHAIPQSPSSGPIQAHTGAGGFCDDCRKWKSGPNAGCTCDSDSKEETDEDTSSERQAAQLSIATEPIMHPQPLPDEPGKEGVSDIDDELANAPSAVGTGTLSRTAEALETVKLPKGDESAQGGPSPKIDKGKSGDQGGWSLEDIDTQMDGSPHPTIDEDPTDKADYNKEEFLDQTKAVTTTEDLPTGTGMDDAGFEATRNITQYPTKTWSGQQGQHNPVTNTALSSRQASDVIPPGSIGVTAPGPYGLQTPPQPLTMQTAPGPFGAQAPMSQDELWAHQQRKLDQAQQRDPAEAYNQYLQGLDDNPEIPSYQRLQSSDHKGAQDPDKNPIQEILEEYSGHLLPNQVEAAIQDWNAPSS